MLSAPFSKVSFLCQLQMSLFWGMVAAFLGCGIEKVATMRVTREACIARPSPVSALLGLSDLEM